MVTGALLDVPPRLMWGWGPHLSGYCGSMTIQTLGIYYGNYFSQDAVRRATGSTAGSHQIMLGNGGCCAAVDVMRSFRLNVSQWPHLTSTRPQHAAFVEWMRNASSAGDPVAFGVFMKTESSPDFDHIVPLVGFDGDGKLTFNDLHANTSLHEAPSTFVSARKQCAADLPWAARFEYCLPSEVNFGVRALGNYDETQQELLPARLIMDSWTEPDYSHEDGKHEVPIRLQASLVVWSLVRGERYALLTYNDKADVPMRDFLKQGKPITRTDFVADSTAHRRRVDFLSNSTTFYRAVRILR
jgi:hypothetical protein